MNGDLGPANEIRINGDGGDDRKAPPGVVVIFGASGDLTERKLMPALARLAQYKRLPDEFRLVGVARSHLSDDEFRQRFPAGPAAEAPGLVETMRYVSGDYDDPETYAHLRDLLDELRPRRRHRRQPAVLPGHPAAGVRADHREPDRRRAQPARPPDGSARLVIEKPYGHDEASARDLDDRIHAGFEEDQVFRIDHYLGKDTVQNVMALRFANTIFQPIWNRTWIDQVQITVAETLGVGSRGGFYEHAGAMRDIVQNHVLQVLALALMEPPASFAPEALRNEKVKLLQSIRHPADGDIDQIAVRGQYTRGGTSGDLMPGYREEQGVDPLSRTETYAAMRLDVDNWRWAGVPFYVRTGKRLPRRVTEVVLQFTRPPHLPISAAQVTGLQPDALILRIQPDEGITLRFGAKVPGHSFRVRTATMEFSYESTFREESPEAYERLLLDALIGDPTLFIRSDEVLQSWRIVDPIIEHWANSRGRIPLYEAASWGPDEADQLLARDGRSWHNPGGR